MYSNLLWYFASRCPPSGPLLSFPGGSDDKESACNAGDPGSIPGLGKSPAKGNDNPLQYSCLENSVDRPWGHKESDMTEPLTLSPQVKGSKGHRRNSVHQTLNFRTTEW